MARYERLEAMEDPGIPDRPRQEHHDEGAGENRSVFQYIEKPAPRLSATAREPNKPKPTNVKPMVAVNRPPSGRTI